MAANLAMPTNRTAEMDSQLQTQIAFYLTGKRRGANLDAVEGPNLRPALLAGYSDLTRLRYDFPLVLLRDPTDKGYVQCLSVLVDGVVRDIAQADDSDRSVKYLLRLEQEIRVLLAGGMAGSLSELWDSAAGRLAAQGDDGFKACLKRARAALKVSGDIVDCDIDLPVRLLNHAWRVAHDNRARKWREELNRLTQKLSEILAADLVRSEAGRSPQSLQAAMGAAHADVFDFEALSRVLAKAAPATAMPASRRRRIQSLLLVLQSQRFFGAVRGVGGESEQTYVFVFDNCKSALAAYRERMPKMLELAKAMAIARLEIEGDYKESNHDPFFKDFAANGLAPEELDRFPHYLVCVGAEKMQGDETDTLMQMFSAGLPAKVLVQTDDLLEESTLAGDAHLACGLRGRQLANMAIGLNDVYVLQSASSNLYQFRDRITKAMSYAGPALFSVYSGAAGKAVGLPPYLAAAAAMESRVFPAITYDPSAGPNWAARFHLDANSQVDLDWPVQTIAYEDERHQKVEEKVVFSLVDFVACDGRYARHFAVVPRVKWNDSMAPVGECLGGGQSGTPGKIPCLLTIDRNNMLQKVIVDDQLMRAAQRCREAWHSLQELAGIHNSHAENLLARERKTWEERERAAVESHAPDAKTKPEAPAAAPASPAAQAPTPAAAEEARSADEPYIETARCTTCNECTQINDKMFAYDGNKQAHIVDPAAGTYRQLVEAAESCQVSIIHPGKPRNPDEPGLEELLQRAEPFL